MLSDPLLDFVRQAMLSRPRPCDSGPHPNGSVQLGAATLAMAQRTQRAKQVQHVQQATAPSRTEDSLSPQPSVSLAGQGSGTSTVSTSMRRSSAGSFAVDIRRVLWVVGGCQLDLCTLFGCSNAGGQHRPFDGL